MTPKSVIRLLPIVAAIGLAPTAHAVNLLEAYHIAQESDPTIASARFALDAARQKIPQARANLLPVASITGNDMCRRSIAT